MTPSASIRRTPRLAGILLRTQPDTRLAVLAGEGSDVAFEEIVRRYRRGLFNVASRVASPSAADDVVQDALVKAHAALERGDRPDMPRAWLFQIVRNTALNERRTWRHYDELDDTIDGVEQPPQTAERRFELSRLVTALGELPDAQRRAIVERELEGKGHDEIATAMGVSAGAVRQLIFRARATLRTGLGAIVPIQLLRLAMLSCGTADQVGGAAGAGLGLGAAAKLGLGAALTTGALVAGAGATKDIEHHAISSLGAPAVASAAEPRAAHQDSHDAAKGNRTPASSAAKNSSPAGARAPSPPNTGHGGGARPSGSRAHPGPVGGQTQGASQPPQGSSQPAQQQSGGAQTRADCPDSPQQPQPQP